MSVKRLPFQLVGPVKTFQLLPTLSVRPLMLTGNAFQAGWVETKATKPEAPTELKAAVECAVRGVPLMYPLRASTLGANASEDIGDASIANSTRHIHRQTPFEKLRLICLLRTKWRMGRCIERVLTSWVLAFFDIAYLPVEVEIEMLRSPERSKSSFGSS